MMYCYQKENRFLNKQEAKLKPMWDEMMKDDKLFMKYYEAGIHKGGTVTYKTQGLDADDSANFIHAAAMCCDRLVDVRDQSKQNGVDARLAEHATVRKRGLPTRRYPGAKKQKLQSGTYPNTRKNKRKRSKKKTCSKPKRQRRKRSR